tara:strand:+ start:403 stop:570 length:168 start_codon:yes stop_codon:yes gene_type:complete
MCRIFVMMAMFVPAFVAMFMPAFMAMFMAAVRVCNGRHHRFEEIAMRSVFCVERR